MLRADSRELFYLFTGGAGGLMVSPLVFFHVARLVEQNLVMFRDPQRRFYQDGIDEERNSIGRLVEWQRSFRNSLPHVDRLYCLGTSMGAYAALLCGHMLGADDVWAFGPFTKLPPEYTLASTPPEHRDLSLLLGRSDTNTRYHVYYNEGYEPDRNEALNVAACRGVSLYPQSGEGHNVVGTLLMQGKLESVMSLASQGRRADVG